MPLGTLDDPGAIRPEMHVFAAQAVSWAMPADALPRFPEGCPFPYRKPGTG